MAAERFGIPETRCFASAEELAARPRFADAAINGTMDRLHVPTSVPLLDAGYHLLLEKPFATGKDEMRTLVETAARGGSHVMVCHVLRYAPFYRAIKERVAAGAIGDVVSVQTVEHVSYHHMAVGFVRGKWRRRAGGSSMLMAKCCHDLDLIMWLKAGSSPVAVSSFGSRSHFRAENAPPGAGTRCLVDCAIEADCLYSARKHYLDHPDRWAFYVWSELEDVSQSHRRAAPGAAEDERLRPMRVAHGQRRRGPPGRRDGVRRRDDGHAQHGRRHGASLPVHPSRRHRPGRSRASSKTRASWSGTSTRATEYSEERVDTDVSGDMQGAFGGHGGGDMRLVEDFVSLVQGEPRSISCTSLDDSISSHLVGFAADAAMEERRVIELSSF